MKKLALLLLSCIMSYSVYADTLSGKWNFEVPMDINGFQSGTVEFKSVENKTVATIDFGQVSYDVDLNETQKDYYEIQVPIMENEVSVTLDNTDGKMKTIVNTTGMTFDVTLTKIAE